MNDDNHHVVRFQDGDGEAAVTVHYRPDGYLMDLRDGALAVRGELLDGGALEADLGGSRCHARVVRRGRELTVFTDGTSHRLQLIDPLAGAAELDAAGGRLAAPMPGKIVEVLVKDGASVKRGAPLLVLEAMKMEHTISALADGKIEKVIYSVGEQVEEGAELIVFQSAGGS